MNNTKKRSPTFYAGPVPAGNSGRCWNIASVSADEGEIVLYGDVLSQQPIDWWTGEPEPGMYITPEGFMEDLAVVKDKSKITVRLNSCGGDLYTGIAIHNAIKSLSAEINVVVEGIAASAASVIMCAGDTVSVYPGSLVMIHEPRCTVVDYCGVDDLKAIIKMLNAGIDSCAEVYAAKTGDTTEHLKSMMHKETWMTGKEAIDKGFADQLLNGEDPDMKMCGKDVLMVAGIKHDIKGLHIPESLGIKQISPAAKAEDIKPTGATEEQKKGETQMFNNTEELRTAEPQLVSQIEAEAADRAVAQAVADERARLRAIDEIAPVVGDELVQEAKYGENPCTAEQLALRAVQAQAALGTTHLQNVAADSAASGVQDVKASSAKEDENKPLTKEERRAQGRAAAKAAKEGK